MRVPVTTSSSSTSSSCAIAGAASASAIADTVIPKMPGLQPETAMLFSAFFVMMHSLTHIARFIADYAEHHIIVCDFGILF
jgi:hypothetical protein